MFLIAHANVEQILVKEGGIDKDLCPNYLILLIFVCSLSANFFCDDKSPLLETGA